MLHEPAEGPASEGRESRVEQDKKQEEEMEKKKKRRAEWERLVGDNCKWYSTEASQGLNAHLTVWGEHLDK